MEHPGVERDLKLTRERFYWACVHSDMEHVVSEGKRDFFFFFLLLILNKSENKSLCVQYWNSSLFNLKGYFCIFAESLNWMCRLRIFSMCDITLCSATSPCFFLNPVSYKIFLYDYNLLCQVHLGGNIIVNALDYIRFDTSKVIILIICRIRCWKKSALLQITE